MNVGQKNLGPRQESNSSTPPEHRAGALSIELQLMERKDF